MHVITGLGEYIYGANYGTAFPPIISARVLTVFWGNRHMMPHRETPVCQRARGQAAGGGSPTYQQLQVLNAHPFKTVCLPLSYSGNPGVNWRI